MEVVIEVFKTNIQSPEIAEVVLTKLQNQFPQAGINFDLEDCDKILRIEGNDFNVDSVIETIIDFGYKCEILE